MTLFMGTVRWVWSLDTLVRFLGTVGTVVYGGAVRWVPWVRYGGYGGYSTGGTMGAPTVPYQAYHTHRTLPPYLTTVPYHRTQRTVPMHRTHRTLPPYLTTVPYHRT